MAVLLPGLALVRDTTGHDWYAAGKLVLTEAMIAIGFDASVLTEYRAADGSVRQITRLRFCYMVEAWQARRHILSTLTSNALLGAAAGFAGALLLAILSRVWSVARLEWVSVAEPILRNVRRGTNTGSGSLEVLPQHTHDGARIALLVTPAEMKHPAGNLKQADRAILRPVAGSDYEATKEPRKLRPPDAAAAEAVNRDESENTESGRTHTPNRSANELSARQASERDSGTTTNGQSSRREPDDDVGWF